jgi:hypothetical protein
VFLVDFAIFIFKLFKTVICKFKHTIMKTIFIILFVLIPLTVFSQIEFTGKLTRNNNISGINNSLEQTQAVKFEGLSSLAPAVNPPMIMNPDATTIRWNFQDPSAIGGDCKISANGIYGIVAWNLNSKRVALYKTTNSTPVWQYTGLTSDSYVAISDTGGIIAAGNNRNIYIFTNTSNVPIVNFDLTTLPDTGLAGPLDITSDGNFLIASAKRSDSSTILCISRQTGMQVWKAKIPNQIYGVKISGNDSLVIVSTYNYYKVLNVYTGAMRHGASVTNATQAIFGINRDGRIIATVDLRGYVHVYEWNGSTYLYKWGYQEAPGTYYNWMTAVDVTEDGNYVAAGSLVFLSSSSYDGRIRYFKVANGNIPIWTYSGCGDEVSSIAFNKYGNILTATSWGDLGHSKPDYYIFKTINDLPTITMLAGLSTGGSMFYCHISNDGKSSFCTGKAVHARVMGSGGLLYSYDIDTTEGSTGIIKENELTANYKLNQNYPNPFNPYTTIKFSIPKTDNVKIILFDITGKEISVIAQNKYPAGTYSIKFDASGLTSGVYFYKILTDKFTEVKKMILLK